MSLDVQFLSLVTMVTAGIYLGLTYHLLTRYIPVKNFFIGLIRDVCFTIGQGALMFYLLYYVNFGEVRFYFFLALVFGVTSYFLFIQTPFLRVLVVFERVVVRLTKYFVMILRILFSPLLFFISIIYRLIKRLTFDFRSKE